MDVKKLKPEIAKEIVLVALTYRTSNATMAKLLNVTAEDVEEIWKKEIEFKIPLYALKKETEYEDEIDARVSYIHARNYFAERNQIRKAIKESTKANDLEKVEQYKLKMKEHFTKIDDTIAKGTIGRGINTLTEIEKEAISRYRLKYGLSLLTCSEVLRHGKKSIAKLDNELSEKDLIFKGKIEKLDDYWRTTKWDYLTIPSDKGIKR